MADRRKRGRPRGSSNTKTIVHKIASEKHKAPKGYSSGMMATVELVFLALRNKAMQGNVEACRLLDEMREKYAPHTEIEHKTIEITLVKPKVPVIRRHDRTGLG